MVEKLGVLGIRGKTDVCLRGNEITEACVKEARVVEGDKGGRVIKGFLSQGSRDARENLKQFG